MKLKRITVKGLHAFPEETTVEFPDLQGLINMRGPNGGGKTSFLDAITLCLFKDTPNRQGGLYEQFKADCRDGRIEVEFEMNGRHYLAIRRVDAQARKQKPFLYVDGVPVTEGKEKEFEDAIAEHFCSEAMFLTSIYAAQENEGNLLNCPEIKQRELFAEMLGLGELEDLHEKAKGRLKEVTREAEDLQLQADQVQSMLQDEQELRLELGKVTIKIDESKRQLQEAEAQLEAKRQELANARANTQNVEQMKLDASELHTQILTLQANIGELESRIKKNKEQLLDQAEVITSAVKEAEEIAKAGIQNQAMLSTLNDQVLQASSKHAESVKKISDELEQTRKDLKDKEDEIAARKRDKEIIEVSISQIDAQIQGLQGSAGLADETPCKGLDIAPKCQLLSSAFSARDKIQDLENEKKVQQEQRDAVIIPDEAPLEEVRKAIAELQEQYQAALTQDVTAELKPQIEALQTEITHLEKRQVELKPLLDLAPHLDGAEERVADYQRQVDEFNRQIQEKEARRAELQKKIDAASDLVKTLQEGEAAVKVIEEMVTARRADLEALSGEKTKLETTLEQNEKIKAQLKDLQERLNLANREVDKWKLYKLAMSPKGIQALETDAAGPEISAICNELLAETFGSRFTIKIETLRELTSKKVKDEETGELVPETRERLQIRVLDNEKAVEGAIQNKSGGEKAILGEILSLAIAIYNKLKSRLEFRTIIRDEVTAALSAENGEKYLEMLRTAKRIGNFDQVIYVSHHEQLQGQADLTLHAEGGKVVQL